MKPEIILVSFAILTRVVSLPVMAKPLESPAEGVSQCRFLGKVTASSGYGKNPNWESIARTYAHQKAEKLGATHVVFASKHQMGAFNGELTLEAYRCQEQGG